MSDDIHCKSLSSEHLLQAQAAVSPARYTTSRGILRASAIFVMVKVLSDKAYDWWQKRKLENVRRDLGEVPSSGLRHLIANLEISTEIISGLVLLRQVIVESIKVYDWWKKREAEREASKHGEQHTMQKQWRQQARTGSARMGVQSPRGPPSSGLRHRGGFQQSPARGRGEHLHDS
ncbi:hypothetical protein PENSOL_c042G03366 [Penicillium solitum]|uniref:Uncharacterized protein n=1 Tax=Penicillium solitum TaxID=60172 RepID=A0A1V6QSX8_9EURO|nr:uncharacterized protein PENSOL_c042G03366 [Penicillium solitum]OQD92328.1 hypothetical protein PENSOL_c042G03366 [Penicillium solitum]